MFLFLFPLAFSFSVSVLGIFFLLRLLRKFPCIGTWRNEKGRERMKTVSRFGGAVTAFAFLGTIFCDPSLRLTWDIVGLLAGCVGMFFVGMWDDIFPLGWRTQLFAQLSIVVCVVLFFHMGVSSLPFFGGRVSFGLFPGGIFAVVWFLLVINALNWSDGIDGVAPGVITLSALAFFAVSMRPEVFQPPVAIVALALLGSYAGLFLFNAYPAKVFSGTTGVFVAGFAIAYVSLFAGAKIATALLVLAIPIADLFRVIAVRYRLGRSITHPETVTHAHYQLLRFGWSERGTGVFLVSVAALASFSSFFLHTGGKMTLFFALIGFFFFFLRGLTR